MGNPKLLLLDEPTEGLAPLIVRTVCDLINIIHQDGISILLVEESIKVILRLCQRVHVMAKGVIVFQGSGNDLREDVQIRKKYLEV